MKNNLLKSDNANSLKGEHHTISMQHIPKHLHPVENPGRLSEPKALLNRLPQKRRAVRKPSSLCLYHFERRNTAPCLSVRTCAKHSPKVAHREKRALANAQEEAHQESADKVVSNFSQDGD